MTYHASCSVDLNAPGLQDLPEQVQGQQNRSTDLRAFLL